MRVLVISITYNMPGIMRLNGQVDKKRFEQTFKKLIEISSLADNLDNHGYKHVRFTLEIDLNGDGKIIVKPVPVSEEVTIDDFDLENLKTPIFLPIRH